MRYRGWWIGFNGAKRIWPLLRILRAFVPLFRDILCGFIDEEDGQPAGLINYMRQRITGPL